MLYFRDDVWNVDFKIKIKRVTQVKEYIEALQGITFEEWIKLRTAIDRRFDQKIGEFKKGLKLSESKIVEDIIHSQFGCKLD